MMDKTQRREGQSAIEENSIPVPNSGCWIWLGHENTPFGYGRIRKSGKKILAHRFSFEAFIGPIPESKVVCHKCDVPSCVNPDHLFVDSVIGNVRDRDHKGRGNFLFGENHSQHKLSEWQVKEAIRARGKMTKKEVAEIFGVSKYTIADIWSGKTWKHLPREDA